MVNHRKTTRKRSLARLADPYELYERAVQEPEHEVRFFDRVFRKAYGHSPLVLREDFCGTAAVCCEWAKSKRSRRAMGVDIDSKPLDWGQKHNLVKLKSEAQQRVTLLQQDVRKVFGPKADIVAAQNFSFFIFKTRTELRHYFRIARRNLGKQGMLMLDVMGGPEVITENHEDVRRIDGQFNYIWEQNRFDPITHDSRFYIHFRFKDGSVLKRAFCYEWRLWSIPEIRELLDEAGFARSDVYWEGTDSETDEGDGVYRARRHAPSDPAWVAYVVGVK